MIWYYNTRLLYVANQETIVELIGFTQRVMGPKTAPKKPANEEHQSEPATATTYTYPVPEDEPKVRYRSNTCGVRGQLIVLLTD